jgi:hypothetical protein
MQAEVTDLRGLRVRLVTEMREDHAFLTKRVSGGF